MKWSNKEINYLIKNYSNVSNDELCKTLNRSWWGVFGKARNLGLKKSKQYMKNKSYSTQIKKGQHLSPETEFKSEDIKGKNNPFYGKHHTKETRKKLSESNIGKRTGENNNKWKGGITSLTDKIRKTNKYKEWREKIYRRDNYTCQLCGDNSGGNLIAHHIVYFHNLIESNNIKILSDIYKCEELWDINNGITFCDKCHEGFHNKNGYD